MTYKEAKAYLQPIADNATLTGYREALCKAIEALEVADSVVHGRWLWDSGAERYFCSNCNVEPSGLCNGCTEHLSNYCPNCGAKMDGGADHESI